MWPYSTGIVSKAFLSGFYRTNASISFGAKDTQTNMLSGFKERQFWKLGYSSSAGGMFIFCSCPLLGGALCHNWASVSILACSVVCRCHKSLWQHKLCFHKQSFACIFLFQLDTLVPRKSGNVKEEMHSRRLCGLKWWMCRQTVVCKLVFILPGTACLWRHIQLGITNILNKQACLFPFEQTRVFPRIVRSFGRGWKVNWSPVCLKAQAMVHLQANPGVVWLRCQC